MTEAFLQYVWRFQLLAGDLKTTDSESVRVVCPGDFNTDAGPDFYNALLFIGDIKWAGTIEVHVKSSDWLQHGHSTDKQYHNVVLHVVYEHDKDVVLQDGRKLPVVELKDIIPDSLWNSYDSLINPPKRMPIACADYIRHIPSFFLNSYCDRLAVERVERKTLDVRRVLESTCGDWELTAFWFTAHYFGGKVNAIPFEQLAKSMNLPLLARWRDNPQRIEALLMGQAGFLDATFEDDYPESLKVDYNSLKSGFNLPGMDASQWKFFRIRPNSFPTIRISQFAQLVSKTPHLFSSLINAGSADQLFSMLDLDASDYWRNHYRFDVKSTPCRKHLGKDLASSIIINAWVPILFEYGKSRSMQQYMDMAIDILYHLEPEKNSIVKLWEDLSVPTPDAARTQALLQLYNEYCTGKKCLDCRIGYNYLKNKL